MSRVSAILRVLAANRRAVLGILVATIAIAGCDGTGVDPFLSSDRYYSIYGSLDMRLSTQFLRVIPIDTLFGVDDDAPIDAVVRSIDLNNSEVETWRDSLITFANGLHGHVFFSKLRIKPGHKYRVEVLRSDGAVTWVETTIPFGAHSGAGSAYRHLAARSSFAGGNADCFLARSDRGTASRRPLLPVQECSRQSFHRREGALFDQEHE